MYNSEWKEAYLTRNNFTNSKQAKIKKAFKESESLETKYDIDLINFSIPQAIELLNQTNYSYKTIYSDYLYWCISEAYIHAQHNPYSMDLKNIKLE